MDQESDVKNETTEEPEVIRQQIDATRSSLTEKLETLEDSVRDTVQGAKDSVENTIDTVKEKVQDTVASVKQTFDLKYQTEHHPWPMFGGSVVAGFVLGSIFGFSRKVPVSWASPYTLSSLTPEPARPGIGYQKNGNRGRVEGDGRERSEEPSKPSLVSKLLEQFDDEIRQVKQLAIGTAVGLVRDLAKRNLPPSMTPQVEKVMDSATTKLGGKPIAGPVVEPTPEVGRAASGTRHPSGYANPVL